MPDENLTEKKRHQVGAPIDRRYRNVDDVRMGFRGTTRAPGVDAHGAADFMPLGDLSKVPWWLLVQDRERLPANAGTDQGFRAFEEFNKRRSNEIIRRIRSRDPAATFGPPPRAPKPENAALGPRPAAPKQTHGDGLAAHEIEQKIRALLAAAGVPVKPEPELGWMEKIERYWAARRADQQGQGK
jgi:hypothetical protein